MFKGQGHVHLDLQRRAQPFGKQLDRVRVQQVGRLHAVLGAGLQQPADELAAAAGHALELEGRGAVADLLHLRSAQVVAQLGMPNQQHRQHHTGAGRQLHQPLEADQRLVVQVMGFVHDQHDRVLVLAHEVAQFALAPFRLCGDLDLAAVAGRQVVEHGLDERGQRRAALVHCQRLRNRNPVEPCEFLLDPGQQMRLARADQARDDDQPASLHDRADLADQGALMLGFEVADPVERPCQPEMRLHVGEHQPLLALLKCSRTRAATVSRSSVSASSASMKPRSGSGRPPNGLESWTEIASSAASGVGNVEASAAGSGNGVCRTAIDAAARDSDGKGLSAPVTAARGNPS